MRTSLALVLMASALLACGARTGLDANDRDTVEGDTDAGEGSFSHDAGADVRAQADDAAIAASLEGLRWELPCTGRVPDPNVCATPPQRTVTAVMGGEPGAVYSVTLRFRGVVELDRYVGGTGDDFWHVGGTPPSASTINVYALEVSSPPQTFYLNEGISHGLAVGLDLTETIPIAAGATVTLSADSRDGYELANLGDGGAPVVVQAVPPAPAPFDGQFIQMDVVSVSR